MSNPNVTAVKDWKDPKVKRGERIECREIYPKKAVTTLSHHINDRLVSNAILGSCELKDKRKRRTALLAARATLRKLLDRAQSEDFSENYFCAPIRYLQQPRQGRLAPEGHVGLTTINKTIRATLARGVYDDFDIANAHPVFLLRYIEMYTPLGLLSPNPSLEEYVHNREEVLERVQMPNPGVKISNREAAKTLMLRIMNGGFPETEADALDHDGFLYRYWSDMQTTLGEFYLLMTTLKGFERFKAKEDKFNKEGVTLNHFLIYAENRCLQAMTEKFTHLGHTVGSLIFDGLHIQRVYDEETDTFSGECQVTDDELRSVEGFVLEKTKFPVSIVKKSFPKGLNLKALAERDVANLKDMPTEEMLMEMYVAHNRHSFRLFHEAKVVYMFSEEHALWEKLTSPLSIGIYIAKELNEIVQATYHDDEMIYKVTRMLGSTNMRTKLGKYLLSYVDVKSPDDERLTFDRAYPYLLPIRDEKVVDLRTKIVHDRESKHMFTYNLDVSFGGGDEEGTAAAVANVDEYFKAYMTDQDGVLNAETYDALKLAIGFSITGETMLKKIFIVVGESNSGKSSFFEVLRCAIGNQHVMNAISEKVILKKADKTIASELTALEDGVRFVYCSEFSGDKNFDSPQLKRLSGNDMVTYRPFGAPERSFQPIAKMWLFCNELPEFDVSDLALLGRFTIFRFPNKFSPTKEGERLLTLLKTKMRGDIFAWVVEQAFRFYENECAIPTTMDMKATKVEVVSEMNPLDGFVDIFERTTNPQGEAWTVETWMTEYKARKKGGKATFISAHGLTLQALYDEYLEWKDPGADVIRYKAFSSAMRKPEGLTTRVTGLDVMVKGRRCKIIFLYRKRPNVEVEPTEKRLLLPRG